MKKENLVHERISVNPEVMSGKPVIAGTRIPVEKVLTHLAGNPDLEELFQAYPELTEDDVKACLDYAKDAVASLPKSGRTNEVSESRAIL